MMFMRKSEGITPQITNGWENYVFAKNPLQYFLKFIYSEKVTNVCEICTVDLTIIGQIYGGDFAYFQNIWTLPSATDTTITNFFV